MKISLPIPPSVNHCYIRRNGRQQLSDQAYAWQDAARYIARQESKKCGWTIPDDGDKVVIELFVYWPNGRRRDMHNLHKLTADALEGAVYSDDRYALLRDMDYTIDRTNPRLELTIYRLGGQ